MPSIKRTISMSVGKGSVSHNTRAFHAENTDPERTQFNRRYVHEDIKAAYHQLFDEALERFNAKQKRQDRCIGDYYKKITKGLQEKPFHELIVQVGNLEDCGATTPEGEKAAQILEQYMSRFQERNPNLHVFSANLHMDEATPHLHIDFVPFTTESKRGLDIRVSLKQALFSQGFKGGTRGDTEWNQWVQAEKERLAEVMLEHGIQWEQKGTHHEHLTVLDYKKQERSREVAELAEKVQSQKVKIQAVEDVELKPTLLDKTKGTVDKADFEDIKRLAKKQIVSKATEKELLHKTLNLQRENLQLKAENESQKSELWEYRIQRHHPKIVGLEAEVKRLKKVIDRMMKFIDRLSLREQLERFLTGKDERGR